MKKSRKQEKEEAMEELRKLVKANIIRPHHDRIITRGKKKYYYSEMTTGAGTHSGPLIPIDLFKKTKTKKK